MTTVLGLNEHPQAPDDKKAREQLLRHALKNAAAAIAGLLTDHPTPADARTVARAWLRTWEAFQVLGALEKHTAELVALAGGAR